MNGCPYFICFPSLLCLCLDTSISSDSPPPPKYYNDKHEDEVVLADRQKYINILKDLERRSRMWVRIPYQQELGFEKLVGKAWIAGKNISPANELAVYEHHIDDFEKFLLPAYQKYCHSSFDPAGSLECVNCEKPEQEVWKCHFGHEYELCKCHCEAIHTGYISVCSDVTTLLKHCCVLLFLVGI